MEFTPFAGLTALDQNDPITIDGASFLIENPRITDHLLQIGAVTHRHDGHAAHPSPTVALSGAAIPTGGQLAASGSFALTWTVLDQYGGETKGAPPLVVNTGGQISTPDIGPTAAVITTSGGIMPAGAYYYGLTYTDGVGGETPIGPATFVYVDPGFASSSVLLSNLRAEFGTGVVDWRLWRSYEGADWHLVSEGSTNTFLDDGFDPPDNPARPPAQNTSGAQYSISVTVPTVGADPALGSGATGIRIYLAPDSGFLDPCFYAQLPMASAGATFVIQSDTVSKGRPPKVSAAIPGAGKINYLTDIINTPAGGGGGGGGGATISPLGPALGVERVSIASGAITANATTNFTIPVPSGWTEQGVNRIVLGLCVSHADPSKLAATLKDPDTDTAQLFNAGDWTTKPDVGFATGGAAGDTDASVYFSDAGQGFVRTDAPGWQTNHQMGGPDGPVNAYPNIFVPRELFVHKMNGDAATGNWTLSIVESGGHTGSVVACDLYLVSKEFDALLQVPAPLVASAAVGGSAAVGREMVFVASGGLTIAVSALDIDHDNVQIKITNTSTGGTGPAGPAGPTGPAGTGTALGVSGSAGVGLITPVSDIEFTGSGGTGVAVQSLGGGSARILISASGIVGPTGPTGPTGPAGSSGGGGSIAVTGSAGVNPVNPVSDVEFGGSAGINVAVQNLGGGSARVVIGEGVQPQARVHTTGNKSLTSGVFTAISWDVTDFNIGALWAAASATRMTAASAGLYLVETAFVIDSSAVGTQRIGFFKINGALAVSAGQDVAPHSGTSEMSFSALHRLAAGDYVEVFAYQDSGGALNVETGNTLQTHFAMTMLGP